MGSDPHPLQHESAKSGFHPGAKNKRPQGVTAQAVKPNSIGATAKSKSPASLADAWARGDTRAKFGSRLLHSLASLAKVGRWVLQPGSRLRYRMQVHCQDKCPGYARGPKPPFQVYGGGSAGLIRGLLAVVFFCTPKKSQAMATVISKRPVWEGST